MGEYDGVGGQIKSYGWKPGSTWSTDPLFMKIGTQYYWYHNDHLGTSHKMTTSSGAVVWSAKHNTFGNAEIATISTVSNNVRFAGQYYDQETGLHYNYFRYYDPKIGRYLRADPIGLEGGINPYQYANANPINFIDPYGLYWEETNAGGWNQFEGPSERHDITSQMLDDYAVRYGSGNFISEEELRSEMQICEVSPPGRIGLRAARHAKSIVQWLKALFAPKKGLGVNPFKGKTPKQIDKMFKKKGFEPRGPDPVRGKGGYVDPKTGRSYHIDKANRYGEPPHVDVNRTRDYKGPLDKRKYGM